MAAVDPYTSRLEAGMRLLTERLAFIDAQARQLAAENEALRAQLDAVGSRIEAAARERAQEILAAAGRGGPISEPAGADAIEGYREQLSARAAALHDEAREQIEQVRRRGSALAAGPESWPPPRGEPAIDLPPPDVGPDPVLADRERRAAALQAEIDALIELRATVVSSIRATLLGLAERLAAAEREHVAGNGG